MSDHLTTHHRRPRSRGGSSQLFNLSYLPARKHEAWHKLFANWEPQQIADEINRFYLDPEFAFVVERRNRC